MRAALTVAERLGLPVVVSSALETSIGLRAGLALAAALPELYACCGTEDELLEDNHRFLDAAGLRGVPVTTSFTPGEHEWGYWDAQIQKVLAWLPL